MVLSPNASSVTLGDGVRVYNKMNLCSSQEITVGFWAPANIQTCAQQGGQICSSTQTCQGGFFSSASDGGFCCISGTCTSQTNQNPSNGSTTCQNGCTLNGKCYPIGYRTSSKYCGSDGTFIAQIQDNSTCNNNFECGSNLCASHQCVSQSLIQKILNWFKSIFGV